MGPVTLWVPKIHRRWLSVRADRRCVGVIRLPRGLGGVTTKMIQVDRAVPEIHRVVTAACRCRKSIAAAFPPLRAARWGRYVLSPMNLVTTIRHLIIGRLRWFATGDSARRRDPRAAASDPGVATTDQPARFAAAQEEAQAQLQHEVQSARDSLEKGTDQLREAAEANQGKVAAWWSDVQKSWDDDIASIRRDFESKKAELDHKAAQRKADSAEEDAEFAIAYAYWAVEEADTGCSTPRWPAWMPTVRQGPAPERRWVMPASTPWR